MLQQKLGWSSPCSSSLDLGRHHSHRLHASRNRSALSLFCYPENRNVLWLNLLLAINGGIRWLSAMVVESSSSSSL